MNALLVILIILAALATVVMLVRGIITFLRTTEAELNSTEAGPSQSSLKQNRMMMGRILFQALAILFVALLLLLNSGK
ncbi:MAG: twin transmembrane helix small protein [Sphingobium sp.]